MKLPFRDGLRLPIIMMLIVGSLVALMARSENDYFQSCTTKAYGWPTPWRIDNCECEGGQTIYPPLNATINIGLVLASGLVGIAASKCLSYRGGSSARSSQACVTDKTPKRTNVHEIND